MTARLWFRLAETLVPALITAAVILSWQADRRDRAQLATQLAAAQQTIADAASREKNRDAALNQTLAQISAQQKAIVTPEQIVKALPQILGLPSPLSVQSVGARFSASPSTEASGGSSPKRLDTLPDNPPAKPATALDAILPSADLKPLYDFALDCQSCQAKLTAAQADLADEKTKSGSLAKERDAAVRAAKGGSALRRIARAAKWFLLGAAAGAIASKAAR